MTVGSFVCMTCAGIHRECNQKIKGVGHSSFTVEDVELMKKSDNDLVNQIYLARYNPSSERLRAPQDNNDQSHLRAWIKAKYVEKRWMGAAGRQPAPAPTSRQPQASAYGQPTVAQLPPKQPEVDLFGEGFTDSSPAPRASSNQGWDAFGQGGGQAQQSSFQANFADFSSPQGQQQEQQHMKNDPFPADFGSTQARQQLQQPVVSNHMQQQTQAPLQANFANFDQQAPPQQQQVFASVNNHQQQPMSQLFTQQQQQQPEGFADFHQMQQPTAFPSQQHNAGGFANFQLQMPTQPMSPGVESSNVSQTQPQQPAPVQVQSNQMNFSPQQQGFASFDQQSQSQPISGFADLKQLQHQLPQQQQPQPAFGGFEQQVHQLGQQIQATKANADSSTNQPNPQDRFAAFDDLQMTQPQSQQQPQQHVSFGSFPSPQQQVSAPTGGMHLSQPALTNIQEVFSSVDQTMPISLDPTIGSLNNKQEPISISTAKFSQMQLSNDKPEKGVSKYKTGQKVYYKSSSYVGMAEIVKIHLDDELEPFYTIAIDGKEKQTDDAHLAERCPLHIEIDSVLSDMSDDQLKQTLEFVTRIKKSSTKAAESVSGDTFSSLGSILAVDTSSFAPTVQLANMQPHTSALQSPPQAAAEIMQPTQASMHQPNTSTGLQQSQPGPMSGLVCSNPELQNFSIPSPPMSPSSTTSTFSPTRNETSQQKMMLMQPPQIQQQQRSMPTVNVDASTGGGGGGGGCGFEGIPSPAGFPSSSQSLQSFSVAPSALSRPALTMQPQMLQQPVSTPDRNPNVPAHPQQADSNQPTVALSPQGGNPFDIY